MDTRTATTAQPMPKRNARKAIQDLVIADIEARKAIGLAKYGTLLKAFNGRDALVDLYQEQLDAVQYTRQLIEEREARGTFQRSNPPWLFVAGLVLGFLLSLLVGCAHAAPFVPETPPPTPAQMAALLAGTTPAAVTPERFELRALPMILLSGSATRLTCFVPRSSTARTVRIALEGVSASVRPNDRIQQIMLIEHVPCGTLLATCTLSTGARRELEIHARGECNSGGDR